MIPITCIEETSDPKIKLEERGSKVIFLNEVRHPFRKIKVDGCVVQNQTAADWVVSKPPVGDLVLELKGRNVDHAIEQVTTTGVAEARRLLLLFRGRCRKERWHKRQ